MQSERVRADPGASRPVIDVLLIATIVLLPIVNRVVLWKGRDGGGAAEVVFVQPFHLALVGVLAAGIVTLLSADRAWSIRWSHLLVLAATAWFVLAFAVHPSWRGAEWFLQVAAASALAWVVAYARRETWRMFLVAIVALAMSQAALGLAQSLTGGRLGISAIEWGDEMHRVAGTTAARGSLPHAYYLAGLLLLGIAAVIVLDSLTVRSRSTAIWSAVALFTAALVLPLTFSRASQLALFPMIVLLLVRQRTRRFAAVLLLGVILGSTLSFEAHTVNVSRSLDVERVDSGRRERLSEALDLVRSEPIFGVGPGQYTLALRELDEDRSDVRPAHNVVLHLTAETGIPGGGLALGLLLAAAGWVLRRSNPLVLIAAAPLAPFVLLDWYPYASAIGIPLSGMWIGTVLIATSSGRALGASPTSRVSGHV